MKTAISTILAALIFGFGYWCSQIAHRYPGQIAERYIKAQQEALDKVPTFREIQRMVGAKEDGIIGPNTIAKWEKAICNQYAIEAMEKMAKGEK